MHGFPGGIAQRPGIGNIRSGNLTNTMGEKKLSRLAEFLLDIRRGTVTLSFMAKHDPALDRLFHALSDPTRRGIVERLLAGPASVSDLARPTGMALPTVMKHIAVLEETGLVLTEKSGRTRLCRASPAPLAAAQTWIEEQRALWEARLDRLDTYVTQLHRKHRDEP